MSNSMPFGLPNQCTRQPSKRKYCATASPGNICPPVPPAMIKIDFEDAFWMVIVFHLALKRDFLHQSLVTPQLL